MSFGTLIKQRRLQAGMSLRAFCSRVGFDPSNWSKVERDLLPAPEDRNKLEIIAQTLNLEKGHRDWFELFDEAAISRKQIPEYVYSNEDVLKALPIFFRTAHGNKPTETELQNIIELLKAR